MSNLPATIRTSDDGHLGPVMRTLTERQQAFVHAIIQTGCSQTRAAELAGYQGNADTLKAQGWKLGHDARIQEAMREEAAKLIRTHAVMAVGVIAEIARNERFAPRDRLRAASELLNRSGLPAQTEHVVKVEHTKTQAQQITEIKAYCHELGLDPRAILGSVGVYVDAEFTVVTEEAPHD